MIRTKKKSFKNEIKKSKLLIFARTQPTNLPIMAQRVFLALLAQIEQTADGNTFVIRGKDIAELSQLAPNVVGQQLAKMSEESDKLRQYTLVIHEEDGNDLRVGLISSSKYLKGERAIRITVDRFLMPYLRRLKNCYDIRYKAGGPMQFRSEYSLPLYEVIMYFLSYGNHYFTVEELRRILNIPDGVVTRVATLNQKVIKKAVQDINVYTNITVSFRPELQGRKTIGYNFIMLNKEKFEKEKDEFISMVVNQPYCFDRKTLENYLEKYGLESLKRNFEYTIRKKPKNFAKYLNKAISGQYAENEVQTSQVASRQLRHQDLKDYVPKDNPNTIDIDTYVFQNSGVKGMYQKFRQKHDLG